MKECTITNEFTDDLDVLRLGGIAAFWGISVWQHYPHRAFGIAGLELRHDRYYDEGQGPCL